MENVKCYGLLVSRNDIGGGQEGDSKKVLVSVPIIITNLFRAYLKQIYLFTK